MIVEHTSEGGETDIAASVRDSWIYWTELYTPIHDRFFPYRGVYLVSPNNHLIGGLSSFREVFLHNIINRFLVLDDFSVEKGVPGHNEVASRLVNLHASKIVLSLEGESSTE